MKKERIEQLVRLLPAEATIFNPNRRVGDVVPTLAACLADALNDPGFGHRFVIEYVCRNEPLPASVYEPCLRQAYNHQAGINRFPDPTMLQVEQLALPAGQFTSHVLNALLVSRDCTYAQISAWMGLDEQTVGFWDQLKFNVRERLAEKAYIARLVFPQGRLQTFTAGGVDELPSATRLLIAGHTYGAQEVLSLAGINTNQTPPSVEQNLKEFEQSLVQNALQLARTGALNSTSAPGIAHGKSLLVAKRDSQSVNNPARVGQPDISIGDAILLSMPRTKAGAERATAAADARLEEHEKFFRELAGR